MEAAEEIAGVCGIHTSVLINAIDMTLIDTEVLVIRI